MTGPGGVVGGFAIGMWSRAFRIAPRRQWQLFGAINAALCLGLLTISLPGSKRHGQILVGTVRGCLPVAKHEDATIQSWDDRVAKSGRGSEPGWKERASSAFATAPGVVVELHVAERHVILEGRKPWDRGELYISSGKRARVKRYYLPSADATCGDHRTGTPVTQYTTKHWSGLAGVEWTYPPTDVPRLLNMRVLEPVPAEYRKLLEAAR